MSAASRPSAGSGSEGRRGSADLPEKINRYVVKRLLGKGGQGAVYHAYDPNLAIDVAVKVLHPDFRSEEFIDRIRAEARTAVRLTAPNVVRVYDFDEQYPYLVMEYCGDGDLNHYLKMRRRRSLAEIASITGQICDALIAAHEHDPPILHRDLKPGNVLFQKQTPKVADFGLAKMLGGGTGLTTTRGVMGTVRYCSPEQLRDASKVDQRTDIWAAGVVLYELLTWMRPFDKPGDSFVSVAVRVHTESPRQPPYEIPAPLMGVILRALEKDADKRYRSAREMRQALDEALRAIPGAADIMLPPEEVVDDRSQKAAQVASLLDAGRSQDAATIVQAIRRSDPDDSLGVYWQRRVKEVSQEGASSSPGQGVSGGAAEEPGGIAQQLGSIQSLIQSRQYREARQRIGELILQAPDNTAVQRLLEKITREEARLRQDIDQAHTEADSARAAGDYAKLYAVWKRLSEAYPDLPEPQAELAVASREMEILEQRKSRDAVVLEAAKLLETGDLRAALAAWQAHTARYPNDQDALREQQQVRDAVTARERAEYLDRVTSEAAQARAGGDLEKALALWEGYLRDDPASESAGREVRDLKAAIAARELERRRAEAGSRAAACTAAGDHKGALSVWEGFLADYADDAAAAAIAARLRQAIAAEEKKAALLEVERLAGELRTRREARRYGSLPAQQQAVDEALRGARGAAAGDAAALAAAATALRAAGADAEAALAQQIATRRQDLLLKVDELRDWLPRESKDVASVASPTEQALDKALSTCLEALCLAQRADAPGDPLEALARAAAGLDEAGASLALERKQALAEAGSLAASALETAEKALRSFADAVGEADQAGALGALEERLRRLQEQAGARVPERLASVARQAAVLRAEAEAGRAAALHALRAEAGTLIEEGLAALLWSPNERVKGLLRTASLALHPENGRHPLPAPELRALRDELRRELEKDRAAREQRLAHARQRWEAALQAWRGLLVKDLGSALAEDGEKTAASGQLALAEARPEELEAWATQLEDLGRRYGLESAWIEQSDTVLEIEGPLGADGLPLADIEPRLRKLLESYRKAAALGDSAAIRTLGPQLKENAGARRRRGRRPVEVELRAAPLRRGARRLNQRYAPAALQAFDDLVARYQKSRSEKRVGEAGRLAAELNGAYRRLLQPPPVWRRPWLPVIVAALVTVIAGSRALVPEAPSAAVTLMSPGGVVEVTGVTRDGRSAPGLAQPVREEGVTWTNLEPGHYVVTVRGGQTREFDVPGAGVVLLPGAEGDYAQPLLRELGLSEIVSRG